MEKNFFKNDFAIYFIIRKKDEEGKKFNLGDISHTRSPFPFLKKKSEIPIFHFRQYDETKVEKRGVKNDI